MQQKAKCVNVILSCYKHLNTEKNRVQVVQLPAIWAKSHVIANKQLDFENSRSTCNFHAPHAFKFVYMLKRISQLFYLSHLTNCYCGLERP